MVRKALRFEKMMTLKKGTWSQEEDQKLIAYINRFGIWNWTEMPRAAGLLRSGKSCRLRWVNYLRPGIKHGNFTREEQETIFKMHEMLGNKWSAIAAALPGRSDNEVKNHWHACLKKRLRETGNQSQESISTEVSDGPRNVPASEQPPSGLCSSPNAGPAVGIDENKKLEADLWSETFGELFSLWDEPLLSEAFLYLENFQDMFVNSGFVPPQDEQWCSEPTSPYGFYNDLWFNSSRSVPVDMVRVKEPNAHF